MNSTKLYIVFLLVMLTIVSCNGNASPRKEFVQYSMNHEETFNPEMIHKSWRLVEDTKDCDLNELFKSKHTVYKISFDHNFQDIEIPEGCDLLFCGGSLKGNIVFNNTYLCGNIRLQGSNLSGTIRNKIFEAGWNCYGDGKQDDAFNINQALNISNSIHFQKGAYFLSSLHQPSMDIEKKFHEAVASHIGLYKSNIRLEGDEGASFISEYKNRMITIYSKPNDIKHSVKKIAICGITFRVKNDGKEFHEFIHAIKTLGVNNLTIENCAFFDFWGDAICLSHYGDNPETGERTRNSNVVIKNNYIDGISHNNRNGVSIINGSNVLISHNTILDTSKNNMPGGIDVEANNSAYTVKNIRIEDNVIEGSYNTGIQIYCNENGAPAHNLTIRSNKISNCFLGIVIGVKSDYTTSNFTIENNEVTGCKKSLHFIGNGKSRNWQFRKNKFSGISNEDIVGKANVENLRVE